jgi:large subunit ribosomal protein L3
VRRTGLIAEKVGMSRVFNENGEHIPVTLLKVTACQVLAQKTLDKHGYTAVQIGMGIAKPSRISKPVRGMFAKLGLETKKHIKEFRITEDAMLNVGDSLSVEHFVPGQFVDVSGVTIGKGFAGPMKRHNFAGLRASHGVSASHRSHGSTGCRQDPGRVFKGKKMAGHMGHVKMTQLNLKIVSVDTEDGLIIVKGCVPGNNGSVVTIRDAIKRPLHKDAPKPAALMDVLGGITNEQQ